MNDTTERPAPGTATDPAATSVDSSVNGAIALCIITFKRPVGLGRLLDSLAELDTGGNDVRVVVVDNDPEGSAREVVEAARADHPLPIAFAVEAQRGITHARNRCVALAHDVGDVGWIGWLDDDEAPRSDWLTLLVDTQRASGADVVMGPSEPIYEPDATDWIIEAGVFDSPRFPTGDPFPFNYARTSGVLVRASKMPVEGFDNRLALSGGSDRVHFTLMHRAGCMFVWNDEAIVDEWIPSSRMNVRWLCKRWFRKGVTRSLTLLLLDDPTLIRRARRVAGGSLMAVRGLGQALWAARRGRVAALTAASPMFFGIGAVYGAFGRHYHEYKTTHGS
ncbi:MAG: glycosyltransferase [Actinomycetota bacterium]